MKRVLFIDYHSFDWKIEPLIISSWVSVIAHDKVILKVINLKCCEKIATFEARIEFKLISSCFWKANFNLIIVKFCYLRYFLGFISVNNKNTKVSFHKYILMQKSTCEIHRLVHSIELFIMMSLVYAIFLIIKLCKRWLIVIMSLLVVIWVGLVLLYERGTTSKWKGL